MYQIADDASECLHTVRGMRSAEGLFVADGRQRIVHWSESAERLLGHRAAEVIGRPCYEVMAGTKPNGHPICRESCPVVVNAQRGRVTPRFQVVARNRDGEPVEAVNSIVLLRDGVSPQPLMMHVFHSEPVRRPAARHMVEPAAATVPAPVPGRLSRREFEVLRLLAAGLGTEQIARELSIAPVTARNHINRLESKLGAHHRLEAVTLAMRHHLL
jgi:PAS domain S-box-containing protein